MHKNKSALVFLALFFMFLLFGGCGAEGNKEGSATIIYGVAAVISVLLVFVSCTVKCKNKKWLILLFISVAVVNVGYYFLARSSTLEQALWANRVSYFGSVFLPMAMLIIILNTVKASYNKYLPLVLAGIGALVFLVAASPGYSTVYYKEVSIEIQNGVTVLKKVYGQWHFLYFVYLASYFAAMSYVVFYAAAKKRIGSVTHAIMLTAAVFINIGIWLIEQFVRIDFELLSVSYIISELFLLGIDYIVLENEMLKGADFDGRNTVKLKRSAFLSDAETAQLEEFVAGINLLTDMEKEVYRCCVEGKTIAETASLLGLKESTVKLCNQNLYCKLGVYSRQQLVELNGYLKR